MQFHFDATQFEPSAGLSPWIDGWHPVVLTSVEPKENQATDASGNKTGRLECVIQAIDGPHKGQTQRFGLNLWHPSAQTVEIANRFLSALIYVTLGVHQGRLSINADTNELCNLPFLIQASRQKDNQNMNDFRAVKDIRGGDPKTGTGAGTVQTVQAAPGGAPAPSFQPPNGAPSFTPPPNGGPMPVQPGGFQQPMQQQAPAPAPAGGGWTPPGGPPAGGAPAPAFQPQQPPQQMQQPAQQFAAPPPGGVAPAPAPAAGGWAPPGGGAPAPAGNAPSWMPPGR